MCLCSVNKNAEKIRSNMICAFASVQNTSFFFHDSLHLLAMLNLSARHVFML